ncbi:MAG: sulfur carrier protein ThiS adenylyltransferase ThiF [Lachnospiraceae bacterium]|nr:sulfur carrier protein ThiS adenylyltransferase ThiF [Lachnospiraceae bacterium]
MGIPTREKVYRALEARHGAELQKKFSGATVAVCGLGGLGSNIAIALARAGVGRLILIDFDKVDLANLNRQQYAVSQIGKDKTEALKETLQAVAPYVEIESHSVRITESNLAGLLCRADVICEAFDRAEEKAMLVNGVLEKLPDKFLVAASGMAGIASANSIKTRRVAGRFYLCGDGVSDSAENLGLISARVMACAAHQAHMVLRILAGEEDA